MKSPTPAMLKALKTAAARDLGTLCPIRGLHGCAEERLIAGLIERGLAEFTEERGPHVPLISQKGRVAAQ